jgi:hypothetical protein
MEKLIIEATVNSPRIVLDPDEQSFEFSGESRPENVRNFYLPVLEWLEKFTTHQSALKESERIIGPPLSFQFRVFQFHLRQIHPGYIQVLECPAFAGCKTGYQVVLRGG